MRIFGRRELSKGWITGIILGVASSVALVVSASNLTIPNTFVPQTGQPISSSQMDANFSAVQSAVNDNQSQITALQGGVQSATCAGNPSLSGDTMVRVGSVCVDKYEASLSSTGTCTNPDGSGCTKIAQSITAVLPAVSVTWAQAARACANAGKRLLTNAEWQTAAIGTPGGSCNLVSGSLRNTDADAGCVSDFGVVDMLGNAVEWVADWSGDAASNVGGVPVTTTLFSEAVGIIRGGDATDATATVEWMMPGTTLSSSDALRGFRCAR